MKQLTCEMCGSTDLIKQDGVYVCQTCGMKYSVEEAKSMMIEGPVDVSGSTIKVDNSAFVQKYLQNARRAKEKEDWEETEKYYNMVEQNDPTNIEAIFYSSYGKAKESLINNDIFKRQSIFKVLQKCVSILDDNFVMEKEKEEKSIITQISDDIIRMSNSSFVYTVHTVKDSPFSSFSSDNSKETYKLFYNLNYEFCTTLNEIIKKYPENDQRITFFYELLIKHYQACKDLMKIMFVFILNIGKINNFNQRIRNVHEKWHLIDESHVIPKWTAPVLKITKKAKPKTSKILKGIIISIWIIIIIIVVIVAS